MSTLPSDLKNERNPCSLNAAATAAPYMTSYFVRGQGLFSFPYSLINCLRMPRPDTLTVEYANATVTLRGRNLLGLHHALVQHRLVEARSVNETTYPFGADDLYIAAIELKFHERK
jgi:hypothetical protein